MNEHILLFYQASSLYVHSKNSKFGEQAPFYTQKNWTESCARDVHVAGVHIYFMNGKDEKNKKQMQSW